MNDFLHELNKEITYNVRQIEISEKNVLRRYYALALAYAEANTKLKNFIIDYEFDNEKEEILFFKQVKPQLVAQLIYRLLAAVNRSFVG